MKRNERTLYSFMALIVIYAVTGQLDLLRLAEVFTPAGLPLH